MPTNVMQQLSLSVILLLTTSLASKMHFSAYQCVVLPMTTLHTCNCYSICTIQTLLPGSTYQWERIPDIHTAEENVTCDMHDELSSQAGCETACAAHSQFHWLLWRRDDTEVTLERNPKTDGCYAGHIFSACT